MEEGSLVQEALRHMQEYRDGSLQQNNNTLVMDAFLLKQQSGISILELFQQLAHLANSWNSWIQSLSWPWHIGGDGLVFGVHISSNAKILIPHLRATCRYGENVADEWFAISIAIVLTEQHSDIVLKCWDVNDGQVLLIESALVLPSWVDGDNNTRMHENVCWIKRGKVTLLRNSSKRHEPIQLKDALKMLDSTDQETKNVETPPAVQEAILNRIKDFVSFLKQRDSPPKHLLKDYLHCSTFVVPRRVALLMKKRPDLVSCAVMAWFQKQDNDNNDKMLGTFVEFEDLVWTTHTLGRTVFAMMQSTATSTIPRAYKSMEANRMKRTCQTESTPHLRHALDHGMYITAGLECLLAQDKQNKPSRNTQEQRILEHWVKVDVACGGNGEWLRQAWAAGPNHAIHDLKDLMQCPVHETEIRHVANPCPLTHPDASLHEQIKSQLNSKANIKTDSSFDVPPKPAEVDDDSWLRFDSVQAMDEAMKEQTKPISPITPPHYDAKTVSLNTEPSHPSDSSETPNNNVDRLTNMLGSFQTFVDEKSDVEGISHSNDKTKTERLRGIDIDQLEDVQINPRVFLNLLHAVLKSKDGSMVFENVAQQPNDPYFSKEDYNLFNEDDDDSSNDSEEEVGKEDQNGESMEAIMQAMDDELRGTQASMVIDNLDDDEIGANDGANDEVAMDTHILSNLLESLDASGGGPGPVQNILTEMGVDPPKPPPDEALD